MIVDMSNTSVDDATPTFDPDSGFQAWLRGLTPEELRRVATDYAVQSEQIKLRDAEAGAHDLAARALSESYRVEAENLRKENGELRRRIDELSARPEDLSERTLRLIDAIDTVMHSDVMKPLRSVAMTEARAFTELGFARRAFDLDLEQRLDNGGFSA